MERSYNVLRSNFSIEKVYQQYKKMKRLLRLITCTMLIFTFMACEKDDVAPEGVVRIVFADSADVHLYSDVTVLVVDYNATVCLIEKHSKGKTPITIPLNIGNYKIVVDYNGHSFQEYIQVRQSQTVELKIQ